MCFTLMLCVLLASVNWKLEGAQVSGNENYQLGLQTGLAP